MWSTQRGNRKNAQVFICLCIHDTAVLKMWHVVLNPTGNPTSYMSHSFNLHWKAHNSPLSWFSGVLKVAEYTGPRYERMFRVAGRHETVANLQAVQSHVRWDSFRYAIMTTE